MTAKRRKSQTHTFLPQPRNGLVQLTQQCISICTLADSSFLSAALKMTAAFLPLQDGFSSSRTHRLQCSVVSGNGSLLSCCQHLTLFSGEAQLSVLPKLSFCVWANWRAKRRWPKAILKMSDIVQETFLLTNFSRAFGQSQWTVVTKSASILKRTFCLT